MVSTSANVVAVDALVAGLNIVDVLARLPEQVGRGDKHEIRDLLIQGGSPAGNAACVIASLGWRTGFVCRLGENMLSSIARAEFVQWGVVEDFFILDPTAFPGVCIVEVDPRSGERTVFYSLTNYHHLETPDIDPGAVRSSRLILVDSYETEAAIAMLEAAAGTACRSVVDVEAGDPAALRQIISLATDTILSLTAAERLTGGRGPTDVLSELSCWTPGQVIVTDGERGSFAAMANGVLHVPATRVNAVDTTGCGDAYHGAYASALLDGLPLPLRMEFAAWVASRVATQLGGRSALPTRDSIRAAEQGKISPALRQHLQSIPRWNSQ